MSRPSEQPGILVISHGSPRDDANQKFVAMVERVAVRLGAPHVLATFFSIARPSIPDRVAELAARGVRRIVLMPYFLGAGQHVTKDIPELLEGCRREHPGLSFEVLPTLENEPALEDLMVDRLLPFAEAEDMAAASGEAIERRSYAIIDRQLAACPPRDPDAQRIVRRVVHATADVSFARTLRIHPQAVEGGRAALAAGRPIFCDVRMLQAGVTKAAGEVVCLIGDEQTAALAKRRGCTRAAAAVELFAPRLEGAIVAVGNAPTALWKVLEIARDGGPRPALVVGLPVGFVGARESKRALLDSDLCYITNTTARGGSPVAAAAVNALALLSRGEP